jgi:hypothetical protein
MENKNQFINLIKYLKRNIGFITLLAIIGLVLGTIYSILKKPQFAAAVTFSLQEDNGLSGGGGLLSLASSFGLDAGSPNGLFSGDNIEQVFKSRKIIEQTLVQNYPQLNTTYGDAFLDINGIRKKLNLPKPFIAKNNKDTDFSRLQDSVVEVIYKYMNLGYLQAGKPDKKIDIYQVSFKSTDEAFSKYFVQELVKQVALYYTATKTKKTKQNVDVLQRRVDSIHRAIGSLMYEKAASADANINPKFQRAKVYEQRKQVDMSALGAGYGELLKNLELARYTLLKETPLFQIIDEPKFPLKKKTYPIYLYASIGTIVFLFFAIFLLIIRKLWKTFMVNV